MASQQPRLLFWSLHLGATAIRVPINACNLCEQNPKGSADSGHLTDDQSCVQVEEDKENYMVFAYLKGGKHEWLVSCSSQIVESSAPVTTVTEGEKVRQGQSLYYVVPSLTSARKKHRNSSTFLTPSSDVIISSTRTGRTENPKLSYQSSPIKRPYLD